MVLTETAIFAGNGFRCPLTTVAKRLGAASGSVTDIYLPRWFARNLPVIHVPLIVLAVALHWRNLRRGDEVRARLPVRQRVGLVSGRDPQRDAPAR